MAGVNESERLTELLQTEQKRVTKLKQLVIKEKKTVAHLNSEVGRLTAELSLSCQVCTNFKSELNQLISDIATPNSGSFGVVSSETIKVESHKESEEAKACSTPCDMPNTVENAISSARQKIEMLVGELKSSRRRERFQLDRLKQLESDLEVLRPLETEINEIKTSFGLANQRVKELSTELSECRISLTLEKDKTEKLRNVIDEMDSSRAAFEEVCRTENLRLGKELEILREQYTLQCTESNVLNQRVVDLTSNLQTMKEQLTAERYTFPILIDSNDSFSHVVTEVNHQDWCSFLLRYLKPVLDSMHERHSTDRELEFMANCVNYISQQLTRTNQIVNFPLLDAEGLTDQSHQRNSMTSFTFEDLEQFFEEIQMLLNLDCEYPSGGEILNAHFEHILSKVRDLVTQKQTVKCKSDISTQLGTNDNAHKLQDLETKVRELEVYAADQCDRAKYYAVELAQRVERQSADYDQLIRGKEAEISELRESCDRLLEDVTVYTDCYYSLMNFYCATCPNLFPEENSTDWSVFASELKSNENTINGRELSHMLNKFVRELTKVLERSINGGDLDCTKPVVMPVVNHQEHLNCAVQTEEIPDSKDALTQALAQLEQANKQTADARNALAEAHGESAKQEEKMQRMKSMLLRLKMDESEHQKAVTELENAKVTIEALHVDLDAMEQKLEHALLENERHKQSLVLLRDDVEQARRESANLRSDRDFAVDRLNKLQNEFSAYKIKALHALRGTQVASDSVIPVHGAHTSRCETTEEPLSYPNVEAYTSELKRLNEQLVAAQQHAEESSLKTTLVSTERDLLREELTELKHKYSDLLTDCKEQQQRWEAQLATVSKVQDHHLMTTREQELEDLLKTERESFELQLRSQAEEHREALDKERTAWAMRLEKVASQHTVSQLQMNASLDRGGVGPMNESAVNRDYVDAPTSKFFSLKSAFSRMQGDGADNGESASHDLHENNGDTHYYSPPSGPLPDSHLSFWDTGRRLNTLRPAVPPLDQLLSKDNLDMRHRLHSNPSFSSCSSPRSERVFGTEQDLVGLSTSLDPSAVMQIAGLRTALGNQQRRVEHLSELLHESESTAVRLEEQAKVLKGEIRRLERLAHLGSQFPLPEQSIACVNNPVEPRDTHSPPTISKDSLLRTEYLKNVVLKVVSLPKESSERSQLITVLSTLLMLSPSETQVLQNGTSQTSSSSDRLNEPRSSWSNYLLGWKT
ncbi:hypothetical protein PHET_08508 [Paragonimus heterotremus]|uniref:GRIP domain-containing protein n=1 Tax=Paragonimus heterotremus TaxID=100268 RepID=A0A8J4SSA1_9TREM|nr:hypothetical protein PHET_08508 [Paragonimus heterotremus]